MNVPVNSLENKLSESAVGKFENVAALHLEVLFENAPVCH
jgi:hypothetical protein